MAHLTKEQAAIIKLDEAQLQELNSEKEILLHEIVQGGKDCKSFLEKLRMGKEKVIKLSEVIALCADSALQSELERARLELLAITKEAKSFHANNAELIGYTLGVVSSTISLFHSPPETEIQAYTKRGKPREKRREAPAAERNSPFSHSA